MVRAMHHVFVATDRSYLAILKKDIRERVASTNFTATQKAEVDIIVAEMASNLIKHGGGGEMLLYISEGEENSFIELICIDSGPGIRDPARMMADGVSTTNTLGHGLGAIQRLSDFFQLYTLKDWGTILLSRIYRKKKVTSEKRTLLEVRSIIVAKPGEIECGDGCSVVTTTKDIRIFLGDGLGHGEEANIAVKKGMTAFKTTVATSPKDMLRDIHLQVKRTRGLVGTIAIYNIKARSWSLCGIGNIAARIQGAIFVKHVVPYNGIVGLNIPTTMKDQELTLEKGQTLIMCSDGIKSRFDIQKYTSILRYDLSILAAAIYKDFARKTDDMSIVITRSI